MIYVDKHSREYHVQIYDITYDKCGFPLFLFYYKGQWVRKSAKYFKPMEG